VETPKPAKPRKNERRLYDDEKIDSMIHYYRLEENKESLFRYIKLQGLVEEDK
jgi:hypothetical protein